LRVYNPVPVWRPHPRGAAAPVVDLVEGWQDTFEAVLGHRMVFAADEYYLLAGRELPPTERYGSFDMHEDGIGMARAFEAEFRGVSDGHAIGVQPGFFAWVDGAPAEGYRAPRWEVGADGPAGTSSDGGSQPVALRRRLPASTAPVAILTGRYGAQVLEPLVASLHRDDVRVLAVENRFFGGNTGVTGLMVGEDLARVLAGQPEGHRYLLPDVCLSGGRFLDGTTPDELPRPVEVVPTDGIALRKALA
jgi:NifB/MoaA-like Fe-S oxidoreductase